MRGEIKPAVGRPDNRAARIKRLKKTLGEIDGRAVEVGWWSLVLEQVDDGVLLTSHRFRAVRSQFAPRVTRCATTWAWVTVVRHDLALWIGRRCSSTGILGRELRSGSLPTS
ncbi:hypothetical protein ACQEVZ_46650 [Dactylosporangium sp. CA-152071]|uniref:hypothetical protein n=1 Tax=Dactylosporangium sp. CA-152071 TaxID=3239933 RepID=UPI003D927DA8